MLGILKNILTFVQAKHIAPKSVKHILRFLFTIVMAVAFINGASGSDSTGQENQGYGAYAETAYFSTDTQDIAPELYVLRQMPSANGIRPQKFAKKKNTTHCCRPYFLPADKAATPECLHFTNQSPPISPLRFAKPADRLVSLGRLII